MIKNPFIIGLLIASLFGAGCGSAPPPQKTSLEIQAFQKKQFETSKKIAFSSVVSVLQDLGYIIKTADLETGLITGSSPTTTTSEGGFLFFSSSDNKMENTAVTAFVEEFGANRASVRLNFVGVNEISTDSGMKARTDEPILDAKVYQDSFSKIQEAIFIREGFK